MVRTGGVAMSFQTMAEVAWYARGVLEKGTLIRFTAVGTRGQKIGVVQHHTSRELCVVCVNDAFTYTLPAREVSVLVLTTIQELTAACRLLCANMAARHGMNVGWVRNAYLVADGDVRVEIDSPNSVLPLDIALSDVEILDFEEAQYLLPR